MAEPRSITGTVVAICSVVVAVCAVLVTVKLLGADFTAAQQPRVFDQTALEQQVANRLQGVGDDSPGRVGCPAAVPVRADTEFKCHVWRHLHSDDVQVTVVNDLGEISVKHS
ncbi:uncharacterized protein DUF4333 [Nocardia tenerifensis]|uniref:Uncharacterized protein DUF4333 n=1 Tax=Nocardia tenerifensis TaxID=228006 RepID=A0A318JX00_9NOCA|nr:DUF4333 domain-containing protein [Nocardia tenerifensis]PXX58156.1 uncharacterized protein DUF4333 [Nocardia tenerifensis]